MRRAVGVLVWVVVALLACDESTAPGDDDDGGVQREDRGIGELPVDAAPDTMWWGDDATPGGDGAANDGGPGADMRDPGPDPDFGPEPPPEDCPDPLPARLGVQAAVHRGLHRAAVGGRRSAPHRVTRRRRGDRRRTAPSRGWGGQHRRDVAAGYAVQPASDGARHGRRRRGHARALPGHVALTRVWSRAAPGRRPPSWSTSGSSAAEQPQASLLATPTTKLHGST